MSMFALVPSAKAAPTCTSYGPTGECLISTGGGGGGSETGGGGEAGGGGRWGGGVAMVAIDGVQCRPAGSANPQPPKSEAVWQGHTDGGIFLCEVPNRVGRGLFEVGYTIEYWAASAPPAPPDPRQLAQQAVEAMQLRAIQVGIVPEARSGSVGLVGTPNWMWAEQPAANTWGPITRSASAAGWTVTATGKVSQVTWDMGDGQVIVCAGPGTRLSRAS